MWARQNATHTYLGNELIGDWINTTSEKPANCMQFTHHAKEKAGSCMAAHNTIRRIHCFSLRNINLIIIQDSYGQHERAVCRPLSPDE